LKLTIFEKDSLDTATDQTGSARSAHDGSKDADLRKVPTFWFLCQIREQFWTVLWISR